MIWPEGSTVTAASNAASTIDRASLSLGEALHLLNELRTAQQRGLAEALVDDIVGLLLIPSRIQTPHPLRQASARAVLQRRVRDGNAIVHGVNLLHEAEVDLMEDHLRDCRGPLRASRRCDARQDLAPVVAVNEPGGGELGAVAVHDFLEALLVVVVAQGLMIIRPADVDDDVARVEDVLLARAYDRSILPLGEELEQEAAQSLVRMKLAIVGADFLRAAAGSL